MTNKFVDLDEILKEPSKPVIEEAIIQEPVLQPKQVDFGRILEEVSYKLPKGYPTIVDGKFVDREEVLIINEFLLEQGIGQLPLPKAKSKLRERDGAKEPPTKFELWYNSVDKTNITPFIETFPIVEALTQGEVTMKSFIKIIESTAGKFDWHETVIDFIPKLKELAKDPRSVAYFDMKYVKGATAASPIKQGGVKNLKSLNGGKPITSFIHNRVQEIYKAVETGETNKVFTADVLLFWGFDALAQEDLVQLISEAVHKPKIKGRSLVDFGGNRYMACVSLKASTGRLGKWLEYAKNYIQVDDSDDVKNEGVMQDLAAKFASTSVGKALLKGIDKIKTMFSDLYSTIKSAISPDSVHVKEFENLSAVLAEFDTLVDEPSITEVNDDSVVCSTCMQERLKQIQPYVDKVLSGKGLNSIKAKLKPLADDKLFLLNLTELDNSIAETKKGYAQLQTTYNKILKATPITTVKEAKLKCTPLSDGGNVLKVSRSELKNILFTDSNALSFDLITNIFDDVFKGVKVDNVKAKKEALIRLTVTLSSEMVFGKSGELPLVKYIGTTAPMELGTKSQYIEEKTKKAANTFGSELKLPIAAITVRPSKGKPGQSPYYYTVLFYTFYNLEETAGESYTPKSVTYAVSGFKCNSGSRFAFTVEADSEVDGDQLINTLKTK